MSASLDAPPPARGPWQRIYAAAHAFRRARAANRQRRLPAPVVSVGNLHWGGSGKTPVVAALAERLVTRRVPVSILSRGYGRDDRSVRVVSLGQGPVLGPRVAGDEPVLLAGLVPGASVVVAPDRWEAGRHALERVSPRPRLFLLDDGFSHVGLARDLDLLTFPRSDPFAGGRLWPGGRLREPLQSARHADAVLLTGATESSEGARLAEALEPFGFSGSGFASRTRALEPVTARGAALPRGASVFLVSAIARPERFVEEARRLPLRVRGALDLADHDPYSDKTLRELENAFRASGAEWLLTTSKDRVKLFGRAELPLAEIPVVAQPEEAFWTWFDRRVDDLLRGVET